MQDSATGIDQGQQLQVAIVGAGMAGLHCARELTNRGLSVVVLDKGSRPGGRMATRPLEGALGDYGAQYIEFNAPVFRHQLRQWQQAGLARTWGYGFEGETEPSGLARYLVPGGMNRLPAWLADGLDVRVRTEVEHVSAKPGGWRAVLRDGGSVEAGAMVLTCPVPQALDLVMRGGVPIEKGLRKQLDTILYEPCFTLLLLVDGPTGIPCPGALALDGDPIAWMADNQQKGVCEQQSVVTVHAGAEFSISRFEDDRDRVKKLLEEAVRPYLQSPIRASYLHRWRYARVRTPAAESCVALQESPPLVLAGDAFGGRDVEAAVLSGLAAAEAVYTQIGEGSVVGD
jgi:renalase